MTGVQTCALPISKRAHIGAGANGPGAALWVEVTEVEEADPTDEVRGCEKIRRRST